MAISLKRVNWGPTLKLALVRAWLAGFVLIMLGLIVGATPFDIPMIIMSMVLYPILSIIAGFIFYLLSFLPMGWGFAIMGTLLFCLGDPLLYILNKKVKAFQIFNNYDLKPINFIPFIVLEKQRGVG